MNPTGQKSIDKIKVAVDGGLLRETRQGSRGGPQVGGGDGRVEKGVTGGEDPIETEIIPCAPTKRQTEWPFPKPLKICFILWQ